MLKRMLYTGIAVALLSCDTDDSSCGGADRNTPLIDVTIEGNIKDVFETGDRIGLFPVEYVDGFPGTLGDVRNPLNIPYRFDGEYWSAAGVDDLVLEGNMTDMFAYYPYDPEVGNTAGKTNLRAYPFDLSGDQSVKETDFLWAKATAITPEENYAHLAFSHVFSRFMIHLNYNDSDPADASLEIHNMQPFVTIDLGSGEVNRINERAEIMPVLMDEAEKGYDLSYSAIVPPGPVPAGTPLFSMDNGNDTVLFTLSSDVVFQAGYTYTFTIILGDAITEPLNPIITRFK